MTSHISWYSKTMFLSGMSIGMIADGHFMFNETKSGKGSSSIPSTYNSVGALLPGIIVGNLLRRHITSSGTIYLQYVVLTVTPTTTESYENPQVTYTFSCTCPVDSDGINICAAKASDELIELFTSGAANVLSDDELTAELSSNYIGQITTTTGVAALTYTDTSGVLNEERSFIIYYTSTTAGELTASLTYTVSEGTVVCLSGDTLITVADFTRKRLDALCAEDYILAGNGTPTRVRTLARGRWNFYHTFYIFEDGSMIDETYEHRFFNREQGFWQKLKKWNIGEHAVKEDGTETALVRKIPVFEKAEMFGIWTESGDYYANGLLSGDASRNQPLLATATAAQAADMLMSLSEEAVKKLMSGGYYD